MRKGAPPDASVAKRLNEASSSPLFRRVRCSLVSILRTVLSGDWRSVVRDFQMRFRGVDLRGASVTELGLDPRRAKPYSDSGGPDLARVLQSLRLQPTDVALDVGCGKGGAMITLSQHGFARVDGLDLCPRLLKVAQANLERLRLPYGKLICADASQVNDLDDYSFLYMYNPFPQEIMRGLMQNLGVSLRRRPRLVLILYRTPVCHDTIIGSGLFVKVGERLAETPKAFFIYTNEPTRKRVGVSAKSF